MASCLAAGHVAVWLVCCTKAGLGDLPGQTYVWQSAVDCLQESHQACMMLLPNTEQSSMKRL
jgi:hypothetical protein